MKPVYVIGNEQGEVYSHEVNVIHVREHFPSGLYGETFPVEIPQSYQGIPFRYGERIFVVFEGKKAFFNGKDFRIHISGSDINRNVDRQWQQMMKGLFLINRWKNERNAK